MLAHTSATSYASRLGATPSSRRNAPIARAASSAKGSSSSSSDERRATATANKVADDDVNDTSALHRVVSGALAAVVVATASPMATIATTAGFLAATGVAAPPSAEAGLSNPNTRLPRNGVSALRRAVPAINPEAGVVQSKLEEAAYLLRIPQRKPWGTMVGTRRVGVCLGLFTYVCFGGAKGEEAMEQGLGLAHIRAVQNSFAPQPTPPLPRSPSPLHRNLSWIIIINHPPVFLRYDAESIVCSPLQMYKRRCAAQ